jgi:hypothetical protein
MITILPSLSLAVESQVAAAGGLRIFTPAGLTAIAQGSGIGRFFRHFSGLRPG